MREEYEGRGRRRGRKDVIVEGEWEGEWWVDGRGRMVGSERKCEGTVEERGSHEGREDGGFGVDGDRGDNCRQQTVIRLKVYEIEDRREQTGVLEEVMKRAPIFS